MTLFDDDELRRARESATTYTYTPRTEEQVHARAHQSVHGNAKPKKKSPKPATLAALVNGAERFVYVSGLLCADDCRALRREIEKFGRDTLIGDGWPEYLEALSEQLLEIREVIVGAETPKGDQQP